MKRRSTTIFLGLLFVLVTAAPVEAQLWFFPDFALPSAGDTPSNWVSGTWGRGLNEASGEADAFGASLGRATGRFSFMGAFGYATEDSEGEFTLGGAAAFSLKSGNGINVAVQGGAGWIDFDEGTSTLKAYRFPIGLSLKEEIQGERSKLTPWLMPRLDISHLTYSEESETETNFGVSGGASWTWESGFGIHTALDALFVEDDSLFKFGLGLHWVWPQP